MQSDQVVPQDQTFGQPLLRSSEPVRLTFSKSQQLRKEGGLPISLLGFAPTGPVKCSCLSFPRTYFLGTPPWPVLHRIIVLLGERPSGLSIPVRKEVMTGSQRISDCGCMEASVNNHLG